VPTPAADTTSELDETVPDQLELPVLGEAPPALWEAAQGGQPVVLTHAGEPALVVLDVDTFEAWAEATGTAP
jgi:hypothetical protein